MTSSSSGTQFYTQAFRTFSTTSSTVSRWHSERVVIDELEKLGSWWVPKGRTVDSESRAGGGGDGYDLHHPKDYGDQKGRFFGLLCGLIIYIF